MCIQACVCPQRERRQRQSLRLIYMGQCLCTDPYPRPKSRRGRLPPPLPSAAGSPTDDNRHGNSTKSCTRRGVCTVETCLCVATGKSHQGRPRPSSRSSAQLHRAASLPSPPAPQPPPSPLLPPQAHSPPQQPQSGKCEASCCSWAEASG